MRNSIKNTVAASLAALVLGLGVVATSAPASAQPLWWGHHHHHGFWGPAAGLGLFGLATGAIIASQYHHSYYDQPYSGDDGCIQYRPVYNGWHQYIGTRAVNVCY